jgi:signal transduction histidine kinase
VTELDGSYVQVSVADNAGGIPADLLEKIFDPYFTTKEKGTGIGLYLTRTIVEQHMHGSIQARNNGSGASFSLHIPKCFASEAPGLGGGAFL